MLSGCRSPAPWSKKKISILGWNAGGDRITMKEAVRINRGSFAKLLLPVALLTNNDQVYFLC